MKKNDNARIRKLTDEFVRILHKLMAIREQENSLGIGDPDRPLYPRVHIVRIKSGEHVPAYFVPKIYLRQKGDQLESFTPLQEGKLMAYIDPIYLVEATPRELKASQLMLKIFWEMSRIQNTPKQKRERKELKTDIKLMQIKNRSDMEKYAGTEAQKIIDSYEADLRKQRLPQGEIDTRLDKKFNQKVNALLQRRYRISKMVKKNT